MLVVQVQVHVKPEHVEDFILATRTNATESLKEPGIARFDVLRLDSDPNRFVLIEAYRDPEAPARHKETPHYLAWRDAVAPMMAEPRTSVRYSGVHVPG
jgi:quinol monooxygenase YgiN